jgi:hypothetical protein
MWSGYWPPSKESTIATNSWNAWGFRIESTFEHIFSHLRWQRDWWK